MFIYEYIIIAVIIIVVIFLYNKGKPGDLSEDDVDKIKETGDIPGFTEWQFNMSIGPILVIFVILFLVIIFMLIS